MIRGIRKQSRKVNHPKIGANGGITVVMFKAQFEDQVASGTKRQTIRPARKRPLKIAAILSFRVWTGLPYRSKQREIARGTLESVEEIEIRQDGVTIGLPGSDRIGWRAGSSGLETFARADGFGSWEEMRAWFDKQHGLPFTGELNKWKPDMQ